ncbi:phage integrase SAM-like domain-containing protein [Bacillus thuringiensis]|uniref:tyrosine-type recombinase/integrase n=1 Tax=Bacillus thuringiensis TaxID=1428 RepID=UPI000B1498FF|nr:phage integrase SAM-like domain-containing protein [Bacillus thuringiensis]
MSLKKKKRITKMESASKKYPQLTLEQALDIIISGKCAEGGRDRTLKDYMKMWGYFTDWLLDNYEVEYFDELTAEMFRNYINYMKYDKKRYEGHKFIDADKQGIGLCDTTININIRTLRALFNHLYREELIEVNPIGKIKLLRQDIDLTNSFTDEEVKGRLLQPNLRDFVGINVLLDSGLCIQELMSLRAADIFV